MDTNTPTTPLDCPACQGSCLAEASEASMISTLRTLQRDPRTCPIFAEARNCPLLDTFKSAVMEAVQVVGERWSLVSFAAEQPGDPTVAERFMTRLPIDHAWQDEGGSP